MSADGAESDLSGGSTAQSEDHFRTLFQSMSDGFCVIEFFDGPHGLLSDYVHVDAKQAYAEHAGIPDVVGEELREMLADEAGALIARYGAVPRTSAPIRFKQGLVATGRILEISSFRVEPGPGRGTF